jgi:hypothetical protein
MRTSLLLGAVLALGLGGCVTAERTTFVPGANQQPLVRDGVPALVSRNSKSIVLVSQAGRQQSPGARTVLVVGITNISKAPIDFRVSDVSVEQLKDGQPVQALNVISYDQLVTEEKTRQVVAAILVGAAAAGNAYSASRAGYGYGTANVYAPSGRVYQVSGSYYDPTAAAIAGASASAQNDAMIASTVEAGRRNMASLEQQVIKDNTLLPGEWYGGQLVFVSPSGEGTEAKKDFRLTIPIAGETHVVTVRQEPSK